MKESVSDACRLLREIVTDDEAEPNVRLRAAEMILDRASESRLAAPPNYRASGARFRPRSLPRQGRASLVPRNFGEVISENGVARTRGMTAPQSPGVRAGVCVPGPDEEQRAEDVGGRVLLVGRPRFVRIA
jgi:hypothetical protein